MQYNLIESQISEYTNSVYPLFSEFLKVYFEYARKKNNSHYTILNHRNSNDIDLTDTLLIDKFYGTYGQYLPKDIALDKRNLIKFLNELYSAKGTEKALKLLFKLIFNSEINITYPGDNLLRASDGVWEQDQFFILNTKYGVLPPVGSQLSLFEDPNAIVTIDKILSISDIKFKIYFKTLQKIDFYEGMKFKSISDEIITYVGELENSLVNVKVLEPGSNWMNGQIFTIPGSPTGTANNTIAKVTHTKNNGQVTDVSIVQFGLGHSEDQTVVVSSYTQKPISTNYNLEIIGDIIQLSIVDYIYNFDEIIVGYSDGNYSDTYCADADWNNDFYTAHRALDVRSTNSNSDYEDTSITVEEWLLSRAKFGCVFGPVGKSIGRFKTNSGQLSNDIIRLQDSFYYQVFSYMIETTKDIKEYKELLNITHPTGTIRFSTFEKIFYENFSITPSSDVSYISTIIHLEDTTDVTELFDISLNKQLTETILLSADGNITNTSDSTYSTEYFVSNYTGYDIALNIG